MPLDLTREVKLSGLVPRRKRESPKAQAPAPGSGQRKGGERGSSLPKKLVGLKIGASQLAAASVATNGAPHLLQLAREPLERGVVVGGEPRDPVALVAALDGFFTKHALPRQGVRLGIASNRIGVRTFEIDGLENQSLLENAIRFRAGEVLPIPLDEAVLDYQLLREDVEDGTRTFRVLLVVAYRDLIDRYVTACNGAGLKLVGIDLEAFALLRALAEREPHELGGDKAALVVVSLGSERSTFAVSDGYVCEFTRVLDWGGAALTLAIARALDVQVPEAETIKCSLSLDGSSPPPEGLSGERNAKAVEAVVRQIGVFARELVSSLQYYQNQPGSLGIGEVVVTGGTAELPGLAVELQRIIGVTVRVGDPLLRFSDPAEVHHDHLSSLTGAIGLGIED